MVRDRGRPFEYALAFPYASRLDPLIIRHNLRSGGKLCWWVSLAPGES